MKLQAVGPGQPVRRSDIVAQCEGAYLCKSPAQYTLIVEKPFVKKQWSRQRFSFEMALARANQVLAQVTEEDDEEPAYEGQETDEAMDLYRESF